jgi:hypothetical protein
MPFNRLAWAVLAAISSAAVSACGSPTTTTPTQATTPAPASTPTVQVFSRNLQAVGEAQFQDITASLGGTLTASATVTTVGAAGDDNRIIVVLTETSCTVATFGTGNSLCTHTAIGDFGETSSASVGVAKGKVVRVWVANTVTPKSYTLTVTVK